MVNNENGALIFFETKINGRNDRIDVLYADLSCLFILGKQTENTESFMQTKGKKQSEV